MRPLPDREPVGTQKQRRMGHGRKPRLDAVHEIYFGPERFASRRPWTVTKDGATGSFAPELMATHAGGIESFAVGNLLEDDPPVVMRREAFVRLKEQVPADNAPGDLVRLLHPCGAVFRPSESVSAVDDRSPDETCRARTPTQGGITRIGQPQTSPVAPRAGPTGPRQKKAIAASAPIILSLSYRGRAAQCAAL